MPLDIALSIVYLLLASALLATMAVKRTFRSSQAFFAYIGFDLAASLAGVALYQRNFFSLSYWCFSFFSFVVDGLLYFWVLAEIGKKLLRINRKSLPHRNLAVLIFVAAAMLVSVIARWTPAPGRSPLWNSYYLCVRVNLVLQLAGFLALISWSGLRKLHWPERELHIATGLGFNCLAWFIFSLLRAQWSSESMYQPLNLFAETANAATVAYWFYYFWIHATPEVATNCSVSKAYFPGERDAEDRRTERCSSLQFHP